MKIRSPNTKMTLKDETTLCLPPPPVSSDKDYRFMNDRSGFDVPLKMLSLSHTLHWIFYRVHVSCIWLKVCMMPGFLRGRGVVVFYNLQYSFPAVSSPPPGHPTHLNRNSTFAVNDTVSWCLQCCSAVLIDINEWDLFLCSLGLIS